MTLQYTSDLHLEFPANVEFIKKNPLQPVGDVLVLAGDIVPFAAMEKHKDFFNFVSDHFKTTYWVPGNHEFYHFDIAEKSGTLHEAIRSNVFLVNNTTAVHENVKLLFSTLWTHISPGHQWHIERNLNDFHLIKHKGKRFTAEHYNALHEECLSFLKKEANSNQPTAVFTHHCPTFMNYPEQYRGDILNEAFAVELFDWIETSSISYWVYGHHHSNIPSFNIGKTTLATNQLGYVQRNEHHLFDTCRTIEL